MDEVFSAETEADICRRAEAARRSRELAELAEGIAEPS
jgi:hypothetical protein